MMPKIKIINQPITLSEVKKIAQATFGEMAKAVVDLEKKILAIGGQMHADSEALLINKGSQQKNLWGFNIYPDEPRGCRLEFSSLINIRPAVNNRSMTIKNAVIKKKIRKIVSDLIQK